MGTVSLPTPKIVYFPKLINIVAGSNDKLDFSEQNAGGALVATLTAGEYKPQDLALHIEEKMNDAGNSNYTVTYNLSGANVNKFTIVSDGTGGNGVFRLTWQTGSNSATTVGDDLGFTTSSDDTGALTYTSDNVAPASTTLTFSEEVRSPKLRITKDASSVLSEAGDLQSRNKKRQTFFSFIISFEDNINIENWLDFIEQSAMEGGQFDYFPDGSGSDFYNFTFVGKTFKPEEMLRVKLFQKFSFTIACREVLPDETINTPSGRGLRVRRLINREQYLQ